MQLTTGTRVRTTQIIDRFPHFIVRPGMEGIVTICNEQTIAVKMDEPIKGAEEWNNEVIWSDVDRGGVLNDLEVV